MFEPTMDRDWESFMPFGQQNRDDKLIEALREMFADQNRQLNAQGQHLAQQTQRIDAVSAQLTALANQQESLRNDFNARWQDLPNLYIPRAEQQAMKLDIRTAALEEFRIAATRELADVKMNVQQQVHEAIQKAAEDVSSTKSSLDARAITFLVTGLSILISATVEIVLKLVFH